MAELLDLPVEWNVIFVFLQEHFGQHGGTGQTFVNRRRWKRSNDYAAFTFPGKTQVVFQSIFGTDSLLYIQPARFKFQRTGTFLADPSVTVQIHPVRFNYHFNYRQSLQELAVTPGFLLLSIGLCLRRNRHAAVLFPDVFILSGCRNGIEQGELVGIQGCQLLTSPPEKLAVQPCYL